MTAASISGRSYELDVLVDGKHFRGNYRVTDGVLRVFYKLTCVSAPIDERSTPAAEMADGLLRQIVRSDGGSGRYEYSLTTRSLL